MFDTNYENYYHFGGSDESHNNSIYQEQSEYMEDKMVIINDECFILLRKINKTIFKNISDVKFYGDYIHADTIKQDNTHYLFLRDIPEVDVEMIDEEKD